jgi:hypothetical protein
MRWLVFNALRIKALRLWLRVRPWLMWAGPVLLALVTAGLLRRRARPSKAPTRDDEHLADALRPGLEKRAAAARKEAEEHKAFAEQRIQEAKAKSELIKKMSPSEVLRESEEYVRKVRARNGGSVLLAFLCALSFPLNASAQGKPIEAEYEGLAGWWIPDDVWRAALADAAELELLQKALVGYQATIAAREREVSALRQQVEMEQALANLTQVKLDAADLKLERAARWYRSPKFLVPLGLVIGAAAVIVPLVVAR